MFWKLDLSPFSSQGRGTPTLLGPLERANLNLNRWPGVRLSPHVKKETDPASETLFYSYSAFQMMDKVQKISDYECYTA
jgi:hypothetical protein